MRNWVDRLVKCGIPEETANRVVCFLFRNHRTMELIAYVRMTEESFLGKMSYIKLFKAEDLENFRAAEPTAEEA